MMMFRSARFRDTQQGIAATLNEVAASLPPESVTIRDLLTLIGEQGLLFFCIILTVPFLTPLPIPGVSTVFGALIMLIALGVIANRLPWLPRQLLDRPINTTQLSPILTRGASLFGGIERFIRPRLLALSNAGGLNRLNGVLLFIAGFLLIIPIPFIPLSNMIPGYAILFLATGMLQRDGVFILLGYLLVIITVIYFGALFIAALAAGSSLGSLIGGGVIFLLPR